MADIDQFVKEIEAGDYDGQLGQAFEALFARAKETEVDFGWRIRLDTDEWTTESVTLQELAFAEKACSTPSNRISYLDLDPLKQMDHLIALIVAHLHHVGGLRVPEAFREASKLTVADLSDLVSIYEVKQVPKGDGVTSNSS